MATKRVVVLGGSSGSLEIVRRIASQLPAGLPAAVCVVLHTAPESPGVVPSIIGNTTALPTSSAETGMRLDNGHIYVAPPDHHLVIEPGRLRITRGPKENCFRPAIDPLFRSAGQVYGPAAIGVILSGDLDDGTTGLWALRQMGGVAIVQDPAEALFPSMPSSALRHVTADHVVASARIAPLLERLLEAPADESRRIAVPEPLEVEMKIANEENPADAGLRQATAPSPVCLPRVSRGPAASQGESAVAVPLPHRTRVLRGESHGCDRQGDRGCPLERRSGAQRGRTAPYHARDPPAPERREPRTGAIPTRECRIRRPNACAGRPKPSGR